MKLRREPHHICPRRAEDNRPVDHKFDVWTTGLGLAGRQGVELSCSYCASLHPRTFMSWVRDGGRVAPTTKNYKVYVKCPYPDKCEGQIVCTKRPYGQFTSVYGMQAKFYFQHLDLDQRLEFVSLMNDHDISVAAPGYFYNLPFFMRSVVPDSQG